VFKQCLKINPSPGLGSSIQEISTILDAFETSGNLACKDYCLKFAPLLENMNSYQKMITIINLRKEWRLLAAGGKSQTIKL
jgi:hypothetical protein